MAMASRHGALVSCFLLVIVIYNFTHIQVTDSATMQESSGFSMKLIPIYSDHSPVNPGNLTDKQRYALILQLSGARSFRLSSSSNITRSKVTNVTPKITQALDAFYLVQVAIGSQRQGALLHFDTGASLTWIQSRDCVNCFPLRYESFRDRSSTSLRRIKCNTRECFPDICDDAYNCLYEEQYADSDTSNGYMARDDFLFYSQDRGVETIRGFLFGVGLDQHKTFGRNTGPRNRIAGMFGMSRGRLSFINQLGPVALGLFSYCLTHWTQGGSVSYLKFGAQASIPPRAGIVHTSPFVNSGTELYFLNLLDIHVNDVTIGIPRSSMGRMLIDNGTPLSGLLAPGYTLLKSAVRRHFVHNNIPLQEYDASHDPDFSFMKFCFRKPSRNFNLFPKITFKFEGGADFTPTNRGAFAIFDDFFCLQIQDSPVDIPILGGFIQTDHIFVHDLRQERLSFARVTDCNGL